MNLTFKKPKKFLTPLGKQQQKQLIIQNIIGEQIQLRIFDQDIDFDELTEIINDGIGCYGYHLEYLNVEFTQDGVDVNADVIYTPPQININIVVGSME